MKTNKETYGIKKKLTAAGAMLLVAAIMMVSTTYAWFTLSTAPEVKGISTTVGANGNLEIALAPADLSTQIQSGTSDSMEVNAGGITAANLTWGNLIDLSDESYGLGEIKLMPAKLNETAGNVGASILETPTYGYDGRVKTLEKNTVTGVYDGTKFAANTEASSKYGVRAIGTSNDVTAQQTALINAKSAISSSLAAAKQGAVAALNANGSKLGSIAISKALSGSDSYSPENVAAIGATKTALAKVAENIETAAKNVLVAIAASGDNGVAVEANSFSWDDQGVVTCTDTEYTLPTTYPTEVTNLLKASSALTSKVATVNPPAALAEGAESYTWADIKDSLGALFDTDGVTVNNIKPDSSKQDEIIDAVVANGMKIEIAFTTGSGVFADIADFVGAYSAAINVVGIKYGSLNLQNGLPAEMQITTTVNPTYGAAMNAAVVTLAATAGAEEPTVTDTYGYALDFFFRTNATNSKLLLQTDAKQRIYGTDSENPETAGAGSTLTFETKEGFGEEAVVNLMKNIRVVFVDVNSKILAKAKLDTDKHGFADGNVTASLYLVDDSGLVKDAASAAITDLTANQETLVTAIVYLDGETITNGDVPNDYLATKGTLNLQFSSSATLIPMNDTALKNG